MNPAKIICEIAGSFKNFDQAKRLIDDLRQTGQTIVKLQTFNPETLASNDAIFEMENTGKRKQKDVFYEEMCSYELQAEIIRYCRRADVKCFSTPSHFSDVDFLVGEGVQWLKIGSDDAMNYPLIEYCANRCEKLFVSTGMCTFDELIEVACYLKMLPVSVVLLYCITSYPAKAEDLNLSTLTSIKSLFPGLTLGYSDHYPKNEACLLAYGLGAEWFEKHVKPSDDFNGVDAQVSSTPKDIKKLQMQLDTMNSMFGSHLRGMGKQESLNRINNRKSLHFKHPLIGGHRLTKDDVIALRPGTGIPPKFLDEFVGKFLRNDVVAGEIIRREDFKDG